MSVHVSSWAWRLDVGDPETKLVILKLADHADDRGFCRPSIELIVRDTCLSRSTVIRRLKRLEELGFLQRERRREGSRNLPNRYQLVRTGDSVQQTPSTSASEFPPAPGDSVPGTPEPSKGNRQGVLANARTREHALIYEALVRECYPSGAKLTAREAKQVAVCATNVQTADGTAEMVPLVARAYRRQQPTWTVTPMALSGKWGMFAPAVAASIACEECGVAGGRHVDGCARIAA